MRKAGVAIKLYARGNSRILRAVCLNKKTRGAQEGGSENEVVLWLGGSVTQERGPAPQVVLWLSEVYQWRAGRRDDEDE